MASLPPFALRWRCWCTALWILKHRSASKCRPPSSFCFLRLLAVHLLRLADSSPSVCYVSFPTGALSPHLEDCLRLVSNNSSSQSLTPLSLRCPWMQWRTQWQKPHGKVFIVSFSGGKRPITRDWISCKVHSHKKGQERGRKWQVESLNTSPYLITSQSHAVQYIHLFPSGVLGKYPCQESPICVICRYHHYEGTRTTHECRTTAS